MPPPIKVGQNSMNYMIFWKKQNCGNDEKITGFQGWGMNRLSTEDFGDSGNTLGMHCNDPAVQPKHVG